MIYELIDIGKGVYGKDGTPIEPQHLFSLSSPTVAGGGDYDNYGWWNLRTDGVQRTTVQSGGIVDFVAGTNMNIYYDAGTVIFESTASGGGGYTHPSKAWADKLNLSGASVISNLTVDHLGHPTNWSVRNLTPGDIGAEPAFTKLAGFNKNFGAVAETVAQGNDSRIINGQTAFSWGNHAGLYRPVTWVPHWNDVTNKPVFSRTVIGLVPNPGGSGTTRFLREDGTWVAPATGITTETDPTVPSHVKNITTTNINNWNSAFGWGNHATQGYVNIATGDGRWLKIEDGFKVSLGIVDCNQTGYETYYRSLIDPDNRPDGTRWMNIFNLRFGDSTISSQLGMGTANQLFSRYLTNGNWGAWVRYWHSGNFNPQDIPVMRTAGDTGVGGLRYAGTVKTQGQLYGGTALPTFATRLNYDGHLYARSFWMSPNNGITTSGSNNTILTLSSTSEILFQAADGGAYNCRVSGGGFKTPLPDNPATLGPAWRFGLRSSTTSNTADSIIRISINGVQYDLLARAV